MQHEEKEILGLPVGLAEYGKTWTLQKALHARVVTGDPRGFLIMVEHEPVLTLGRHAKPEFLLFAKDHLKARGIALFQIDRGGEVTAHEPGQLVVYPILHLERFQLAPKKYVRILEDSVIAVLACYGIAANTDPEHPGVWVGRDKICAVGVRIKERATMHGIGFNVNNDLSTFATIVPCGIQGRGVTTLARLIEREVRVSEVSQLFAKVFCERLGAHYMERDTANLQWPDGDLMISV